MNNNIIIIPVKDMTTERSYAVSIALPLDNPKAGFYIMEIWKEIKGTQGLYYVSSYGRIWSVKNKMIRKDTDNGKGYRFIKLTVKGKSKLHYVHRLVCLNFIENPENKKLVNHKDLNKSNNHLSNLEWVTASENMIHARDNGVLHISEYQKKRIKEANSGENSHLSKLTDKIVLEIRKIYSERKLNYLEISKMFNVDRGTIGYIVRNKTWKHLL